MLIGFVIFIYHVFFFMERICPHEHRNAARRWNNISAELVFSTVGALRPRRHGWITFVSKNPLHQMIDSHLNRFAVLLLPRKHHGNTVSLSSGQRCRDC